MADQTSSPAPAQPAAAERLPRERRTHHHLRELIDEMLAGVRVAVNRDYWTEEERRAAEADLTRIMDAVRQEALADPERARGGSRKT